MCQAAEAHEECACSGRVDVDTRRPRRARPYSRIAGCSVPRCSRRRSAHARHLSARQRRRRCGVSLQRGVTGGLTAVCSSRQCALNVGFRAAPARGRLTRVYSKLITQRERLQGSLRGRFRKAYLIPQSALRVRGRCGTIPRFWLRLLVRIRSLDRFSVWMFF